MGAENQRHRVRIPLTANEASLGGGPVRPPINIGHDAIQQTRVDVEAGTRNQAWSSPPYKSRPRRASGGCRQSAN